MLRNVSLHDEGSRYFFRKFMPVHYIIYDSDEENCPFYTKFLTFNLTVLNKHYVFDFSLNFSGNISKEMYQLDANNFTMILFS